MDMRASMNTSVNMNGNLTVFLNVSLGMRVNARLVQLKSVDSSVSVNTNGEQ